MEEKAMNESVQIEIRDLTKIYKLNKKQMQEYVLLLYSASYRIYKYTQYDYDHHIRQSISEWNRHVSHSYTHASILPQSMDSFRYSPVMAKAWFSGPLPFPRSSMAPRAPER